MREQGGSDRGRTAEEPAPQGVGIGRLDRAYQFCRVTGLDGTDEHLPSVLQLHVPLVLRGVAGRQPATTAPVHTLDPIHESSTRASHAAVALRARRRRSSERSASLSPPHSPYLTEWLSA